MNVVVTGGGTVAPIDDVRLIANISSGRFAASISEAFLDRGATVWHVHAASSQLPLWREARFRLDTADAEAEIARLARLRERWRNVRERLHLVPLREGTVSDYAQTLREALTARPIDVAVLAMAASDYEPAPHAGKLASSEGPLIVRCRPTQKVIRSVRGWAPSVYLVGFKLLSRSNRDELAQRAEEACRTNRADLTVANDLQTLRQGRHTLHLVRPGADVETLPPGDDLAERLVDRILGWAGEANTAVAKGSRRGAT